MVHFTTLLCLTLDRTVSPINIPHSPSDERRLLGAQEHYDVGNLLGVTPTSEGRAIRLSPPLEEVRRAFRLRHLPSALFQFRLLTGVSIQPGAMALHRIPLPAYSNVADFVSPHTACLEEMYAALLEIAVCPRIEAILTIAPRWRRRSSFALAVSPRLEGRVHLR